MQPNIPTTPHYFSQFRNTSQYMKNWRISVRQSHFPLKDNHQWCSPFLLHISSGFFDSEQTKPLRSLYRKSRKWSSSPFPNNFTNLYRLYNFELVTGIFHEHFSVDIMGDKRKSILLFHYSFIFKKYLSLTNRKRIVPSSCSCSGSAAWYTPCCYSSPFSALIRWSSSLKNGTVTALRTTI